MRNSYKSTGLYFNIVEKDNYFDVVTKEMSFAFSMI